MKINVKRLLIATSVLLSSIPLTLHGYLGYFSRYIADDFCSVMQAERLGILRATWFWYLNWSGRYSASMLDAIVGLLGPKAVPFVVSFTIMIWLAALTALFRVTLDQLKNSVLVSLALATTSLFSLFLLAPDIRQSLYWGQGMRSVVPPLIMGTLQVILWNYIRAREWTRLPLVFSGILSFFWALVAGGFSETYAALQVAALMLSILVLLIAKKFKFSTETVFLVSGLLGAITAVMIIALAPGSSERQSYFPAPPGMVGILTISLQSFFVYSISLVNSPEKILTIFSLFSLAALAGSQLERAMNARLLVVILGLMIGLTLTCFPPAAYAMSGPPPDRTLIVPTYFFVIGLLAFGIVSGNLLRQKQNFIVVRWLPGLMILALMLSVSINSLNLYQSRSEFIEYAKFWDETDAKIRAAKQNGEKQVLVPAVPNWISLALPNDNPKFWLNLCMSLYYDVQIFGDTPPSTSGSQDQINSPSQ
jgi:hypothetical protein